MHRPVIWLLSANGGSMKVSVLLVISFLFAGLSATAADVNAFCYTAVGGTTTFVIKSKDSVVNFEIFNHNGGGYAPFWSNLVVPNDLGTLAKKAEIIKKLDKGFKATWKTDQCKWVGEKKFACVGATEKVNVNGLEIEPWAVYSSLLKDSSFAGDYEYVDMTVSFEIADESYSYTMRYPADECLLSETEIVEKFKK